MTGGGFRPTFRSPLSEKSVLEEGVFKRILSQCRCSSAPPSRSLTAIPRNILRLARSESFGVASRAAEIGAAGAQQRSTSHRPSRQNRRLSRPLFRQAFAAAWFPHSLNIFRPQIRDLIPHLRRDAMFCQINAG